MSENTEAFAEWTILELMGHRRLFGHVTEVAVAGGSFLRIDVFPGDAEEPALTQFYRPEAVYCMTPTTEELARRGAAAGFTKPVHRYELTAPDPGPEEEERSCRVCGCTDLNACEGGCSWVDEDLCSACADEEAL